MPDQAFDTPNHRRFARRYERLNRAFEGRWLGQHREQLIADLAGDVLEIGAGTGVNLPYYRHARKVILAEPAPAMRAILAGRLDTASIAVEVLPAAAEHLPLPDASVDVVVSTLVLCSVDDVPRALAEAARVLRPHGRLVFLEHVRSLGPRGWVQDRIEPLWCRIGAGCRPNRDLVSAMCVAGFALRRLDTFKPWPNIPISTPFVEGIALRPSAQAEAELRWLSGGSAEPAAG